MPKSSASLFVVAMKFMSMRTCGGSMSSCSQRARTFAIFGVVPV